MLNPEIGQSVGARLSRPEYTTEMLKRFIQLNIKESEDGNPREIEIGGQKTFLYIPFSLLCLIRVLSLYDEGTQNRFFSQFEPDLEKASYMIIRSAPSFENEHLR